jgi:hypothetical protein
VNTQPSFAFIQRTEPKFPAGFERPVSIFGISILLYLDPDLLLEKLHRNHDLTRIRAIGGAAQVSVLTILLLVVD